MLHLTRQERKVLLFMGFFILVVSLLRFFNVNSLVVNPTEVINQAQVININTANADSLQNIPGVGEVIAIRIVKYRNEFGKFKELDDLKKVKGIGSKKIKKLEKLGLKL
ncbi:MAG: helix-hairpin-helix domain-containing protein [Candidatus Omnitrophica bacterium]|nr:helix-hairpin-helix domain-containing protein [Candidatus Omnitrophota bacterium]